MTIDQNEDRLASWRHHPFEAVFICNCTGPHRTVRAELLIKHSAYLPCLTHLSPTRPLQRLISTTSACIKVDLGPNSAGGYDGVGQ